MFGHRQDERALVRLQAFEESVELIGHGNAVAARNRFRQAVRGASRNPRHVVMPKEATSVRGDEPLSPLQHGTLHCAFGLVATSWVEPANNEDDAMSLFGSIISKIFGGGAASAQASAPHASETPSVSSAAIGAGGAGSGSSSASAPSMAGAPSPNSAPTDSAASVDVGQVLSDMAAKKDENLNYKQSIVDLLKLLDLDSSLTARKQLADELHYTGDKEDSATMNVWLHKQVVQKLAENGGKVPADMQHA